MSDLWQPRRKSGYLKETGAYVLVIGVINLDVPLDCDLCACHKVRVAFSRFFVEDDALFMQSQVSKRNMESKLIW